jgi:RNA polymerase sigma factor (sigma-70 family)
MPSEALTYSRFNSLYITHKGWLQHWIQGRLGDGFTAADLTHDTFLRVWRKIQTDNYFELKEPKAYLRTVAKRLMVNHYERQSLERAFIETLAQLPAPLAPSIEEQAIVLEILHELDVLLYGLPPHVRAAFLMAQLEGLTYEDIAARLQVNVRTVSRYMAQGFRQCLGLMLARD